MAEIQSAEAQSLLSTYSRIPLLLERGKGSYVFAADGRRYLDFITGIGVNALGYNHPRITRVIRQQAARLIHCSNLYYHAYQAPLAQRLTALAGMERAFFTNSGTEALEGALKLARLHGRSLAAEKVEIVALDNSFHGRTFGALSVTGQSRYRLPYEPALPGVRFIPVNDQTALAAAIGPQTAAVLLEPIQGEGGVVPLDGAFLAAAADHARRHQAVLILDEIQCGLGRTGRPFAFQWTPVAPDIVVTAKPIACGLPLGVILARGAVAAGFTPGMHGTTFGGGPLVCRVALEFLDIWDEQNLLTNVAARGAELSAGLEALKRKQKAIQVVRGRGLMWGVELDRPAKPIVDAARELGLLANATHDTVIRLLPPYNITSALINKALRLLARAFRVAAKA